MAEWRIHGVCLSSFSSLTLGPSRRCGKSSSTITTSEITASGEAPSLSLSTSASPTRHAVLCGWTRNLSFEDGSFWCCWTISSEIYFQITQHKPSPRHTTPLLFPIGCQWPTSPDYFESVIPLWCNVPDKRSWRTVPRRSLPVFCVGVPASGCSQSCCWPLVRTSVDLAGVSHT